MFRVGMSNSPETLSEAGEGVRGPQRRREDEQKGLRLGAILEEAGSRMGDGAAQRRGKVPRNRLGWRSYICRCRARVLS